MQVKTLINRSLERSHTYIVTNEFNECLIIDASADALDIEAQIGKAKVVGLIITHAHYDHIATLEQIVRHFDTTCYIHKNDLPKLYNPKYNYSMVFNVVRSCRLPEGEVKPLKDKDNLKLGHFDISTYWTPGHTDGCICIDVNGELLFTGDTKFYGTYGRTDLLTGSQEEMLKSLDFLDKNFKGREFYPGHGRNGIV